jgi:hypothetical protein
LKLNNPGQITHPFERELIADEVWHEYKALQEENETKNLLAAMGAVEKKTW